MFAGSYAAATWVTGTAEGILFGTLPASGHPRSLGRSAECSSASSHFTKERFAPPRGVSWLPRKTDSARPNGSRWGGAEGCPLKQRPQPALLPGGAVQRAARRRCRRELLKRILRADQARWSIRKYAPRCRPDLTGACSAIGSIPYAARIPNAYVLLDSPSQTRGA